MGWRTILLDPPWKKERGAGKIKRGANRHYDLLKTADMPRVIHESQVFLPAEHCHLWIWATRTTIPDALWLGKELGFEYKTEATWVKTIDPKDIADSLIAQAKNKSEFLDTFDLTGLQIGLGQYMRGTHEPLLFFTRGKGQDESVWTGSHFALSTIRARRTKHSAKPDESYELIEEVSKGPRLEMFARSGRVGWTSWGNHFDNHEEE